MADTVALRMDHVTIVTNSRERGVETALYGFQLALFLFLFLLLTFPSLPFYLLIATTGGETERETKVFCATMKRKPD